MSQNFDNSSEPDIVLNDITNRCSDFFNNKYDNRTMKFITHKINTMKYSFWCHNTIDNQAYFYIYFQITNTNPLKIAVSFSKFIYAPDDVFQFEQSSDSQKLINDIMEKVQQWSVAKFDTYELSLLKLRSYPPSNISQSNIAVPVPKPLPAAAPVIIVPPTELVPAAAPVIKVPPTELVPAPALVPITLPPQPLPAPSPPQSNSDLIKQHQFLVSMQEIHNRVNIISHILLDLECFYIHAEEESKKRILDELNQVITFLAPNK